MEFDQEILVRMVWQGVPVLDLPTRVRYLDPSEGGVSHFRLFEDNVRITCLHTRLSLLSLLRRARGARLHATPARAGRAPASKPGLSGPGE